MELGISTLVLALLECIAFHNRYPLMYLLLSIALVLLIAGIIFLLHKSQQENRNEVVDRTAPLATPDLDFHSPQAVAPAVVAAVTAEDESKPSAMGETTEEPENWLDQVKRLRELDDLAGALRFCEQQYPRIQAFQQAAVILRQLIRNMIEQHKPVVAEVRQLYRIAVLADLFRNSNPLKPREPLVALASLLTLEFEYKSIGTRLLRLLTKSDIRHLEQLWGKPLTHQHAEETLGTKWQELCR